MAPAAFERILQSARILQAGVGDFTKPHSNNLQLRHFHRPRPWQVHVPNSARAQGENAKNARQNHMAKEQVTGSKTRGKSVNLPVHRQAPREAGSEASEEAGQSAKANGTH